ncbi:hypothetical protein HPC49_07760 [Pyxidicoccus fallax]|uniref:Iminophenyl-pyruvate dimer synthase domain-containing protein n=1 Tax=Pyxidicoccus fallax TaxID=394095 RepID=A0A848LBV2_9BACT|nr:ferritin-like domain-containing protein [Pyxidicoccus fallax]NMO16530.1 hypothetical protein [Pyxidicoccus fallax]NPC78149.1 hypothetical protein [Pyxidicoccus fallax]
MRSRMSRHLDSLLRFEPAAAELRALAPKARGVKPLVRTEPVLPPEFSWHDYAVLLLHIAAEVEHALMAQYLYAAYSLGGPQVPAKHRERVRHWQEVVLGIAKEEMGHLITVQNVLTLIGAPLNLDREDYPWGAQFYPFEFTLEPLTKNSLARYIYAEMPAGWDTDEAKEIKKRALQGSTGQQPLHRVGELYDRMQKILANPEYVRDADFQPATTTFQASWDEWGRGYMRGARGQATSPERQRTPDVIIRPVSTRDEAVEALAAVGKQGEARFYDEDDSERSHFRRFLDIYREYPDGEWTPTRPVPLNPKTVMDLNANRVVRTAKARGAAPARESTVITHPESVTWAHLFNVRYRMLLVYLSHAYQLAGATGQGDALTPRGLIINRTFGEMYNVRALSHILVDLPLDESGSGAVAGPTFEMPYTLDLPDKEPDRWRLHRDLLETAQQLVRTLRARNPDRHADYLRALEDLDGAALESVRQMIPKP